MSGWTRGLVIAAPRPHHGLGNRVRVVLGARLLARHVGRDFAYAWPLGARFGARFDELWDIRDRRVSALSSRGRRFATRTAGKTSLWMASAADERVWQIRTAHALRCLRERRRGERSAVARPVDALEDDYLVPRRPLRRRALRGRHGPHHPISNQQALWTRRSSGTSTACRDPPHAARSPVLPVGRTPEGQACIAARCRTRSRSPRGRLQLEGRAARRSSTCTCWPVRDTSWPRSTPLPGNRAAAGRPRLRLETTRSKRTPCWRAGDQLGRRRLPRPARRRRAADASSPSAPGRSGVESLGAGPPGRRVPRRRAG